MSNLNVNQKERVFELIRKYIAYRMTSEEMVSNLKTAGFDISERTLRRYKQQIREKSGANLTEIYQNEIVDNIIEDIFTIKELQRQGWQEYNKGRSSSEKIKALNLIRNSISDKVKLYGNIPLKFRLAQSSIPPQNLITDLGDGPTKL